MFFSDAFLEIYNDLDLSQVAKYGISMKICNVKYESFETESVKIAVNLIIPHTTPSFLDGRTS